MLDGRIPLLPLIPVGTALVIVAARSKDWRAVGSSPRESAPTSSR
jgi:hypothetical protein